jgi:hypothetical protein
MNIAEIKARADGWYAPSDASADVKALVARVDELEAALRQSAEWFQGYADGHTAKGDTDKAKRNQDRADFCSAALAMKAPAKPEYKQEDGG